MIVRFSVFLLGVVMVPTFCFASDVDEYVKNSKQEVKNTKKKLQNTSGIFGQPSHRGTVIRPAEPSEQPKVDSSDEENSGE